MNYSYPQVVFKEVPDEISLAISITGCPLTCKGCHSEETKNINFGEKLNIETIDKLINKNKGISCFLFYGGEWEYENLIKYLIYIKKTYNLKTALYTGLVLKKIDKTILNYLDYLKVGPYKEKKGDLSSKNTNQKMYLIENGKISTNITYKFQSVGN